MTSSNRSFFLAAAVAAAPVAADPSVVVAGYELVEISDAVSPTLRSEVSQLAFAGDGSMFAARSTARAVTRYAVDVSTFALGASVDVATFEFDVIGLDFLGDDLYVSLNGDGDGRIARLRDLDDDGSFEDRVDFVREIPRGSHHVNQLQIVGTTLMTTIGTATNGGRPKFENPYLGTIVRIPDLLAVDYSGVNTLPDVDTFVAGTAGPGGLQLYAAGFRNLFGFRVAADGTVWGTENGARECLDCSDWRWFPLTTPDYLFGPIADGDRGNFPPEGQEGGVPSTIDPLADLGNHACATGFDWMPSGPDAGHIAIANYGPTILGDPIGQNVVLVDPATGAWRELVTGLDRPTELVADPWGGLVIADHEAARIYRLTPPDDVEVPVESRSWSDLKRGF